MKIYRKQAHPLILLIEINALRALAVLLAILMLIAVVAIARGCGDKRQSSAEDVEEEVFEPQPEGNLVEYYGKKLNYKSEFNDMNEVHLSSAMAVGLKDCPESREDILQHHRKLVHIGTSSLYKVDDLTHSVPYLTAGADAVLTGIAKAFRDSLAAHSLPEYKIVVTSVLRTRADVKKLSKNNVNASQNSAHCYGTTFDISYVKYEKIVEGGDYMEPYSLTKILSEVLRDSRRRGDIWVKYEVKQHCFHITSRR